MEMSQLQLMKRKSDKSQEENHDYSLLERLKQGNIACFKELYRKYSGKIYHFIMHLSSGNTYLAEEIVQNVFIKIWEIHSNINTDGSFDALLYTISRNMFLNETKRLLQEKIYRDSINIFENESQSVVENEIEYHFMIEQINKLIAKLPKKRRKVYMLSRINRLSNRQIAQKLGVTENTVESQLNKANHFIRNNILID